jgi:uncharacterized Tic20 family protein
MEADMSYEDLKVLDELRKSGALSEEEYEREKAKILNAAGQPQPPAPAAYTYAPNQQGTSAPLFGMKENTYLMMMHLSQFAGVVIPLLGLAAPIVLWAINKDTNPNVDATGKRIFNFLLSYLIYSVVSGILVMVFIGTLLLAALGVMSLVFIILAAVKANNGETWNYPLSIRFFS